MVNYACPFNQSELGKYFEWIFNYFYYYWGHSWNVSAVCNNLVYALSVRNINRVCRRALFREHWFFILFCLLLFVRLIVSFLCLADSLYKGGEIDHGRVPMSRQVRINKSIFSCKLDLLAFVSKYDLMRLLPKQDNFIRFNFLPC